MNTTLEKQLNKMSLEDLLEVQTEVGKLIKEYQKGRRKELQKKFKEMASQAGFTLNEVVGSGVDEPKKRNYKPKYQNPENPDQTWTGLGKKTALDDGFVR